MLNDGHPLKRNALSVHHDASICGFIRPRCRIQWYTDVRDTGSSVSVLPKSVYQDFFNATVMTTVRIRDPDD